jgi:hypothetical protein
MSGVVYVALLMAAPAFGYLTGCLSAPGSRWSGYAIILVAPLALYSLSLAIVPESAPPGYWSWWMAGMAMIWPILLGWMMLVSLGFAVSCIRAR